MPDVVIDGHVPLDPRDTPAAINGDIDAKTKPGALAVFHGSISAALPMCAGG